jgi:8-oxo-dGTP pyrophosphatase MutT (NUDIX family)
MIQKLVKAVGVILTRTNGEILVLRRHKTSLEGEKLGLVGGYIDEQEDAISALQREMLEEVGMKIVASELIFLNKYNWEIGHGVLSFETYKYLLDSDQKMVLDEAENTEYYWMKPDELYKRTDLMKGLYLILEDVYKVKSL